MNKDFFKTPAAIGATIVIIGFLLPWVAIPIGSISGYDIPKAGAMIASLQGMIPGNNDSSSTLPPQIYYILYLIPLLSMYLIYGEYSNNKKLFLPATVVIFLLCAISVYRIKNLDQSFEVGFGLWITLAGSAFLLIMAIKNVVSPPPVASVTNQTTEGEPTPVKSPFSSKATKIVIASIAVVVIVGGLYTILHKNSYQKTMSAFENSKWEEVNDNYDKAQSDMASGALKFDIDEIRKLEIVHILANNFIAMDAFKKKYYASNQSDLQTYIDENKEFARAFSELLNKPEDAGKFEIEVDKVYKPYTSFADSFNLAFAECILPDSLVKNFNNNTNVDINLDFINSLFVRLMDTTNADTQKRRDKIRNNIADLNKLLLKRSQGEGYDIVQ